MQMKQKLLNLLVGFLFKNFYFYLNFILLAILGFTGLINQVQYHAAVTDKDIPANAGGWNGRMNDNNKN